MTYSDWTEPARLLKASLLPVTSDQLELAAFVGLQLDNDLPRGVAGTVLTDALRSRVWGAPAGPTATLQPTDRQMEFLDQIAHGEAWARATVLTRATASAWIGHFLAEGTALRLEELQLVRGDLVIKTSSWVDAVTGEFHEWSQEFTVSSISADGLVYFRGGNGQCAWPTSLRAISPL